MSRVLFVTSNVDFFLSIGEGFKLNKQSDCLFKGKLNRKDIDLLLVDSTKIGSTLSLTHFLSVQDKKIDKIIVVNPIQCPDINIPISKIIIADSVAEWDKPFKDTKIYKINVPENITNIIVGRCMSGDRECVNKITPILQSKLIDTISFPVSVVAGYFNIPIISIGIVADHCSQNYFKLLQSNIKELSSKMISFIKSTSSILLGE